MAEAFANVDIPDTIKETINNDSEDDADGSEDYDTFLRKVFLWIFVWICHRWMFLW